MPTSSKTATKKPAKKTTKVAKKQREKARLSDAATFSVRLREARQRAGFDIPAVATSFGTTKEAYARLERGGSLPRSETLLRIARLFSVSTDWLLGLTD